MSYLNPDELLEVTASNSSFSRQLPGMQLAWDSTSLGLLKECPYKYYLSIALSWAPRSESVHLTFGLHYHAAIERYDHARAAGQDHDTAVQVALLYALQATWRQDLNRPWSSDHDTKNRFTLIRSIVWYLDKYQEDSLQTVILADGKPAVELTFNMGTDYLCSYTEEAFSLSGHIDRLVALGDDYYIADKKTTGSTLTAKFFENFSPDNQMSLYSLAGRVVYHTPIKGIIIDAAQIAVTFSRFDRGMVPRTQAVLDEWYADLGQWLQQAEFYATTNRWPRNEKACGNYGGCPFRPICSRSPQVRDEWLKVDYHKRQWDPLQARGDI